MEAIKCPICGSEKVEQITDEKYVCQSCDNEFLVHNLSKEFSMTDQHIDAVHNEIKKDLSKIMAGNTTDEQALLMKAEQHLSQGNWELASDIYDQLATEFPQHSAGWYGLYRSLTGNFQGSGRYALFLCDGNYINDDEEVDSYFYGNGYIQRALSCEDANTEEIKNNVFNFLCQCAREGKADVEDSIRHVLSECSDLLSQLSGTREQAKKLKGKDKTVALMPAIIIGILLLICVWYFFASGDWLGKVIGVVGCVLVLKYGGGVISKSLRKSKEEGLGWDDALAEQIRPIIEEMDQKATALIAFCTDLDNYNTVLGRMNNRDAFIDYYINDPESALQSYADNANVDTERFVFNFLDGKIEKYRYLL